MTHQYILHSVCVRARVCVCACVCVCEGERAGKYNFDGLAVQKIFQQPYMLQQNCLYCSVQLKMMVSLLISSKKEFF